MVRGAPGGGGGGRAPWGRAPVVGDNAMTSFHHTHTLMLLPQPHHALQLPPRAACWRAPPAQDRLHGALLPRGRPHRGCPRGRCPPEGPQPAHDEDVGEQQQVGGGVGAATGGGRKGTGARGWNRKPSMPLPLPRDADPCLPLPLPPRTYVFSALIPLLLHPHGRLSRLEPISKYKAMWYELVVKCTIKVTKALQQAIEVRRVIGRGGGACRGAPRCAGSAGRGLGGVPACR